MRILFITTFYPPYVVGGWEQNIEETNAALQARSHVTHVLTSVHGVQGPSREKGVDRLLTLEADLAHYQPLSLMTYRRRLNRNLQVTRKVIERFNPDVVYVNIMWNLTRGIPALAEKLCPGRVAYFMSDHWPCVPDPHEEYWQQKAARPIRDVFKRLLSPVALRWVRRLNRDFQLEFRRVLCVSHAIRNEMIERARLHPDNLHVVYNGVDIDRFYRECSTARVPQDRLALLFAGSLVWHKGVHTAVEAMHILKQSGKLTGVHLTIVGSGHPDYERRLREMVKEYALDAAIEFRPRMNRDDIPDLLPKFHALIFPSTWEEPLARMTQEAMVSGLVVIATATGGTGEIVIEGETGLTFPAGDAEALAAQIQRLHGNPGLYLNLARQGQALIVEKCDLRRMNAEIEAHLKEFVTVPTGGSVAAVS
ncbi:MAG: glycosyltransferase family 1 protein [Acidobacteria bacterium]|nr:MAG: glycosyltransferase family 1 protein [Acidobacteriota bacterium]